MRVHPRCFGLVAGVPISLAGCSYDVSLGSGPIYRLAATSCGTWDSSGTHSVGHYFVGHSIAKPNDTISYFVFDLTPARGKTLAAVSLIIPGTSDWKITVPEPGPTPLLQFKLGTTPLPASLTLAEVTGGAADPKVYQDVHAEQDLGFGWVSSGAMTSAYDAFFYDGARIQTALNAGGPYPIFAVQRFGENASTEEYLYGGGVCGPDVVLSLTVK
jgi:hypothetical protein